jgi:hypothetical protein
MSHQTDEALVQFLWCEVCTEVDFILCNIVWFVFPNKSFVNRNA